MLTMALERMPRTATADLMGLTAACLRTFVMEILDAIVVI